MSSRTIDLVDSEWRDLSLLQRLPGRLKNWLLVGVAAGFLFVWIMPVTYEVADDIGAQMILAGDDGFAAAAEVPFLSWTFNHSFYLLYQAAPAVPWYGILLVTTQALGLSLLGFCLASSISHRRWLACLIPFFLAFAYQSLLTLTFTKAALTLEFAVFAFLLLQRLHPHQFNKNKWTQQKVALGLLILALLWRWKLGLLCFVFAAPLLLFTSKKLRRVLIINLFLVLTVVAIDRSLDRLTRPPAWQEYMSFYSLRAELFDMPSGRVGERPTDLSAVTTAANWTADDYELIRNSWMLHDQRLANSHSFQRFLTAAKTADASSSWKQTVGHLRDNALLLFTFLPLILAVVLLQSRDALADPLLSKKLWAALLLGAPFLFLTYFRLVPRIAMPILFYILTVFALLVRSSDQKSKPSLQSWFSDKANVRQVLAIMLLTLSGWQCFQLLRVQTNVVLVRRGNLLAGEVVIDKLKKPATLIRLSPDALPGWEGCHPLQRINSNPNLRIVPAGWQIGSPRYNSILADLGFESGSEMLSRWASNPSVGQYFVRRITGTFFAPASPAGFTWTEKALRDFLSPERIAEFPENWVVKLSEFRSKVIEEQYAGDETLLIAATPSEQAALWYQWFAKIDVTPLSPAWKSYFQRWQPQRSLDDPRTTWIKIKNSDQLAIFQLHE
ncbi:MAG: hypothetical protein HN617_06535 [Planctomycetaceae bacterium]|nr:hypothetical protein [Planctomycetaceae bacterium]MBT4726054.1 hypothetical protein [Planctomycetaceae bacterium]MBT4844264.1 hypothetical protein [Planctomycetaceae bacterium]MBT5124416.1 hypothetical protein [Planctomycetaceae bacterium]MBT5598479.1 hypothetical protein [Planctomycetaceae bacterium]